MQFCHVKTSDGEPMFTCKFTKCIIDPDYASDCPGSICNYFGRCECCLFECQDAETGGIACDLEQ